MNFEQGEKLDEVDNKTNVQAVNLRSCKILHFLR